MGHHMLLAGGKWIARNDIVVQARGVDYVDRGHAPAEDPYRAIGYDRVIADRFGIGIELP